MLLYGPGQRRRAKLVFVFSQTYWNQLREEEKTRRDILCHASTSQLLGFVHGDFRSGRVNYKSDLMRQRVIFFGDL